MTMGLFGEMTTLLETVAAKVSVELFALLGTFVEEIIAPIPSPFVMATAGSIAAAQGKTVTFLLWLALIGAVGKVFGALILYWLADKAEDVVMVKFGKFFGVSHTEVEKMGKLLTSGLRTNLILLSIRALPVIPSAPVSIVAGVIKINIRTYIWTTLVGTFVKNIVYGAAGYSGLEIYYAFIKGLESTESVVEVILAGIFLAVLAYLYYRRRQTNPVDWIRRWTSNKKSE